jgi:hypothetical protein
MNKRLNTVLFILGATVANLVIMAVLAIGGFLLLSVLPVGSSSPGIKNLLLIVVFFGAIVGSFFIYHAIVKAISKRIDMDKYFHPIFKRKEDREE